MSNAPITICRKDASEDGSKDKMWVHLFLFGYHAMNAQHEKNVHDKKLQCTSYAFSSIPNSLLFLETLIDFPWLTSWTHTTTYFLGAKIT